MDRCCLKFTIMIAGLITFLGVVLLHQLGQAFQPSISISKESGTGSGREHWGYFDVRQGAHMFWWLYYSTHPDGYENRPWIIWLQGGPGLSSIHYGNFLEIGPLDQHFQPRNYTWVRSASVLFIESPVGTGFSYVDADNLHAKNIAEITADLITAVRLFLSKFTEFKTRPLHIFGQSYGGKMATHLAYQLSREIQNGNIQCDLRSVSIGNGWISPLDFNLQYSTMLYQLSRFDSEDVAGVRKYEDALRKSMEAGDWEKAFKKWSKLNDYVWEHGHGFDYYNIMNVYTMFRNNTSDQDTPHEEGTIPRISIYDIDIEDVIDGPVRDKLGIIPTGMNYSAFKYSVVDALSDFMAPAIDTVDALLTLTNVSVVVYEGQLDLICNAAGAMDWVNKLTWPGKAQYQKARRAVIKNPTQNTITAFVKSVPQFTFYWILNSGHAVPADTPRAAFNMLQSILQNQHT